MKQQPHNAQKNHPTGGVMEPCQGYSRVCVQWEWQDNMGEWRKARSNHRDTLRMALVDPQKCQFWHPDSKIVSPMGIDPHLQGVHYTKWVYLLSGFATGVHTEDFCRGRQVPAHWLSLQHSLQLPRWCPGHRRKSHEKHLTQQALTTTSPNAGWLVQGGPGNLQKTPCGSWCPISCINLLLFRLLLHQNNHLRSHIIAFYYLLKVEEYSCKGIWNDSKQTLQFKLKDITFFHHHHDWSNSSHNIHHTISSCLHILSHSSGKGCAYIRKLTTRYYHVQFGI